MKLELFKKDSCPYCQKVMKYISAVERTDVILCDIIQDEGNRIRLISEGGKLQVPCLFIDGKPMYESDDIIEWLMDHPQK